MNVMNIPERYTNQTFNEALDYFSKIVNDKKFIPDLNKNGTFSHRAYYHDEESKRFAHYAKITGFRTWPDVHRGLGRRDFYKNPRGKIIEYLNEKVFKINHFKKENAEITFNNFRSIILNAYDFPSDYDKNFLRSMLKEMEEGKTEIEHLYIYQGERCKMCKRR